MNSIDIFDTPTGHLWEHIVMSLVNKQEHEVNIGLVWYTSNSIYHPINVCRLDYYMLNLAT